MTKWIWVWVWVGQKWSGFGDGEGCLLAWLLAEVLIWRQIVLGQGNERRGVEGKEGRRRKEGRKEGNEKGIKEGEGVVVCK